MKAIIPNELKELLSQNKLGTLRISKKSKKYIAEITINFPEEESFDSAVMGIDLGLKIPDVCVIDTKQVEKLSILQLQINASAIKLEKLANILRTARTSRKNEKNLHTEFL